MVLGTLLGCYWGRMAQRAFLETFATTVVVKDVLKDVTTLSVTGNGRVPKVSGFSRAGQQGAAQTSGTHSLLGW